MLPVRQKDRFRLGGTGVKMLNAVQFLFPAGQFMLLDGAVRILVHGGAADDARLHATPHDLAVNVKGRCAVPDEVAFPDEGLQIFLRPGVGFRGMDGFLARINVGTADMQEGGVVSGGHLFGLPVVHDVIGQGGHPGGHIPWRPQGGEGVESGHGKDERLGVAAMIQGADGGNKPRQNTCRNEQRCMPGGKACRIGKMEESGKCPSGRIFSL